MVRKELPIISNGIFVLIVLSGFIALTLSTTPCNLREEESGHVCVCNASYCDYLDDPVPASKQDFILVSTTQAGLRFDVTTKGKFNVFKKFYIIDHDQQQNQQTQGLEESVDFDNVIENEFVDERALPITRNVHLKINRSEQYQKIVGFGGSFTGAVSHNMDLLPAGLQDHVYNSYYSQKGIGFNLMRMSIGGCDFDLAPWAYNEAPENDAKLTNFAKLDPRDERKVEQIKRLKKVSGVKNLRIKGAAWSSPPWMKSNNRWTGFSHLKQEFYQTWADYHLKWLDLMHDKGLPIWAISTGNEPLNGVYFMFFVKFMSLGWTPQAQAIWLNDYLGPTIRASKHKDLLIFGNDDQRYTFPIWFPLMNKTRPGSLDYLNGLSVHWYWDEMVSPSFMDVAHKAMPHKILMVSESCIGDKPWQKSKPVLGSWHRGEKYARDYIQNLQHNVNAWIDWNLILDEKGGPNYVDNTVDAPIIVNTGNPSEVLKQPMFYTIGHFSKFIPEGSIRISSVHSNVNIDTVAFLRPDGSICVNILNTGRVRVEVNFEDSERGILIFNIPPKSLHTLIYK